MSKQGMVVKGMMDYASVVNFLEDFVKSFKEKTVCVQRGDDFITLTPSETMEVEIEASIKKGKQKVAIELEWREEVQTEADVAFKVSAVEPEPKPEPEVEDAGEETPAVAEEKKEAEAEEKKENKSGDDAAAPQTPKSVDTIQGTPSILAPAPTSKPVVEQKAETKTDKAGEPAKGGSKSAAKNKAGGAKKTTSPTTK